MGIGTAGSGRPVVLIRGLGPQHTGRHWRDRALHRVEVGRPRRSFAAWVAPRPTGLAQGTTIEQLADLYAAAISARFAGPVDLIGVSTGGSIALQLAIDHPDLTSRLVLVSAAYRLADEGRAAQRDIAENLRLRRPRRAAAVMLATTTTRPGQRKLRRVTGFALGRLALGQNSEDLIAFLEAEDRFDVRADLPRVRTPTLVIGGGRDGYYSPDLFEHTATSVTDGTAVHLPESSHLALATSGAVARRIKDFLTPTRPPRPRLRAGRRATAAKPRSPQRHAAPRRRSGGASRHWFGVGTVLDR